MSASDLRTTTTTVEQGPDIGSDICWDDGWPFSWRPYRGATSDGGGTEQATKAGRGEIDAGSDSVHGLTSKQTLDGIGQEGGFGGVGDDGGAITHVAERGLLAGPQAALRPILRSTFHAAARVVAGLLGHGYEDPRVELPVVGAEVDVSFNRNQACELYLVRTVEDAFELTRLAKQTVKVVGHKSERFMQVVQYLLERRPTYVALVRGEIVVFEPQDGVVVPTLLRNGPHYVCALPLHPRP